jgi:hypothetical protein
LTALKGLTRLNVNEDFEERVIMYELDDLLGLEYERLDMTEVGGQGSSWGVHCVVHLVVQHLCADVAHAQAGKVVNWPRMLLLLGT